MASLTLHSDDGPNTPLVTIDLGEPSESGYYGSGDLAFTGGNLYLYLDGEEYGSLFIVNRNGRPEIALGQYDHAAEDYVFRNPLTESVNTIIARVEATTP